MMISNGWDRTHPGLFEQLVAECGAFQFVAEVTSPGEAFDLVRSDVGFALLPDGVCENLPEGTSARRMLDIPPLQRVLVHRPRDGEFATTLADNILLELGSGNIIPGKKEPESASETRRETLPSKLQSIRSRPFTR
jgi:hypothetical protein